MDATVILFAVPAKDTTPVAPFTDCTLPFAASVTQLAAVLAGKAANIL